MYRMLERTRWWHRLLASAVVASALGVAAGATAANPAASLAPRAGTASRTLGGCVAAWNRAVLGTGRRFVLGTAGDGRAALMFAFRDHTCGFAFPTSVVNAAGDIGVYVSALGGDYELDNDPLSGPASTIDAASLEARASRRTDVRVELPSGQLVAARGASLATSSATLLDAKTPCPSVNVEPSGDGYKVLQRTVGCVWVRTLAWAWDDRTSGGRKGHAVQRFLGWRCVGSSRQPLGRGGPLVYTRVTCDKRAGPVPLEVSFLA